jgi:DNA-directed RNA polymerase II subunit RPB3
LPEVENGTDNKGMLTFTIKNTNVSIANALRRIILSDIKTVVIDTDDDSINISENTTRFHNEILKQRLGCIPVHITEFDNIENLQLELHQQNDKDSLMYVTTSDFKIKDIVTNKYLADSTVKKIFPSNSFTKEFILFTRLRPKISNDIPGEIIKLKAKFKLGTSKQDGMYNVVSTCAYKNTEDKVEQHNQWQNIAEKMEEEGITTKKIDYKKADWYTLDAKRFYKQNSFDFKLESVGVFKNIEIIHNAIETLIFKLDNINQLCNDEQIELDKTATAMSNSFDIKLVGEDYTIGKVLEYILHEEYYKKQKLLNYVGFIKKHPHDDYSIIRVAFKETDDLDIQTHENVYKILQFACDVGKKIFLNIKEYF